MSQSRRSFVRTTGLAGAAALATGRTGLGRAVLDTGRPVVETVRTPHLDIGYEQSGPRDGFPIILLHGFPYDARAWDEVAPLLAHEGFRALVPYLRGYGPTRFRDPSVPRTAEQAAIGQDVIDFADALGIGRFAVCGFDWGNRAANIAAVLHPDRVRAAVHIGGYTIQNTVDAPTPGSPAGERRSWYIWYFNTERGRLGLQANRRELCKLLWSDFSPGWQFGDDLYDRTAPSFDCPDFVDVVIHSYRHRNLNAPGEPRFLEVEKRLAQRPQSHVPTITLYGADGAGGAPSGDASGDRAVYADLRDRRIVPGGHCLPCQAPQPVAAALLELMAHT